MARRVPILIAVLIAIALCYFLFRPRDVVEPEHGSAQAEAAKVTSAPRIEPTSEPVRAGSERESAAVPPSEVSSSSVLAVLVIAKEDRRPLAGIRLTVFPKDPKPGSSSRDVDGNRGTIETGPRTNADGRAEFDLPPGVALTISAGAEDWTTGFAHLEVPALQPSTRRELTIELLTGNDVVFHAQVLGREDRRPIAMATVYVENTGGRIHAHDGKLESGPSIPRSRDVSTDAEGRFELEIATWMAPWARISAEGFALALVAPRCGHETRESAQEILLDRAAALKIHLIGAKGAALSAARVRAGTESYHVQQPEGASLGDWTSIPDPQWGVDTDADGRCTLGGLPPGAPLRVEVSRGGKLLRKEAEPITLRPGEVREVEWTIGGGCRLSGRVTDSKNDPVVSQEIWVLGAESEKAEYLEAYAEERVVARAKTDEEGRYHVDDLKASRLLVGPAPSRAYIGPASEDAIAPLAVVVEIPEGAREVERDLVVHRGLYIRGHVFDPAGAPAFRAAVMGSTDDGIMHQGTQGGEDGSFSLGPLVPGVFRLRAMGIGKYATSDAVTASAGDEGVDLRLVSAGALTGSVVDAKTGQSCRADIAVSWKDPSSPFLMIGNTKEDGSFKFEGLRPGAYDISASTENGRSGSLHGVAVVADSASGGLIVQVTPGAKVTVRYQGKAMWGQFQLESGGVLLGGDGLHTGTSSTRVVPSGRLIARFFLRNPERTQEKELDIAVGEEKQVEFTDGG